MEPAPPSPIVAVDDTDTDITSSVPVKSLRSTVRGVLSIVAPTSLVVALLYYFGWTRTSYEARALGLDDSLFGYSTQDYVLRSVSSMYWPLFIGAAALLVGLVFHSAISSWLGDRAANPQRVRYGVALAIGLAVGGVALLALGAAGERVTSPSRFVSLYTPVAVTISIVLLVYAAHLFAEYGPARGTSPFAREAREYAPIAWSLVVVLLLLSLFWTVSHYAGVRGNDLAVQAVKAVPSQPDVTIYSAKRLFLEPPVVETKLPDANAAYRYRYSGLKLLFKSEHNYFLRPSDPSDPTNIVIADSPDLRFEFTRPRR